MKTVFKFVASLPVVFFFYNCNTKAKQESKNIETGKPQINSPYSGDTSIHFIHEYGKLHLDSSSFILFRCGLYFNQFGVLAFKSFGAVEAEFYVGKGYTQTPIFLTTIYGANMKDTTGYHEEQMNKIIDTASFIKIGPEYFKDKNNIYLFTPMSDGGHFSLFKKADHNSFVCLDSTFYGKDKNHCFYRGRIIEGADPKTFKVLDAKKTYNNAFDKNYFYHGTEKLTKQEIKDQKLDAVRKAVFGF